MVRQFIGREREGSRRSVENWWSRSINAPHTEDWLVLLDSTVRSITYLLCNNVITGTVRTPEYSVHCTSTVVSRTKQMVRLMTVLYQLFSIFGSSIVMSSHRKVSSNYLQLVRCSCMTIYQNGANIGERHDDIRSVRYHAYLAGPVKCVVLDI